MAFCDSVWVAVCVFNRGGTVGESWQDRRNLGQPVDVRRADNHELRRYLGTSERIDAMRGQFFGLLAATLVGLIVLYGVWLVLKALWSVFTDIRTDRELSQLADEYSLRRDQRKAEESDRLDNGCDHEYGHPLGALPDNVCVHCGLAKKRPAGECDHIWRVIRGVIPESRCEQCGETYTTAARTHS